jgi:hypothetical protein
VGINVSEGNTEFPPIWTAQMNTASLYDHTRHAFPSQPTVRLPSPSLVLTKRILQHNSVLPSGQQIITCYDHPTFA